MKRILRDVVCGWTDVLWLVPCHRRSGGWIGHIKIRLAGMGPKVGETFELTHELTKGPKAAHGHVSRDGEPQKKFRHIQRSQQANKINSSSRDSRSRAFGRKPIPYGGGAVKPDCRKTSGCIDQRLSNVRSQHASAESCIPLEHGNSIITDL